MFRNGEKVFLIFLFFLSSSQVFLTEIIKISWKCDMLRFCLCEDYAIEFHLVLNPINFSSHIYALKTEKDLIITSFLRAEKYHYHAIRLTYN